MRKTFAGKPCSNILRFHNIREWLRPSARAFISWGWRAREYSNSWCIGYIVSFNHLSRYLSSYRSDVNQLAGLDRGVAEGFCIYLRDELSARAAYTTAGHVASFATWARKWGMGFRMGSTRTQSGYDIHVSINIPHQTSSVLYPIKC